MHYPMLFLFLHHELASSSMYEEKVIVVVFAMVIYVWGMFGLWMNLILSDNWYLVN